MNKTTKIFTIIALVFCFYITLSSFVFAAEPEVLFEDTETGVKIIQDAAGGIVLSGNARNCSAARINTQHVLNANSISGEIHSIARTQGGVASQYVDYEYNPIYIGTWNNIDCYARHTLGSYNSTLGYLTSYGICSWYNTRGYNALPYRNGNATVPSEAVVDVARFSYFDIRDLSTDTATTLRVNDWGPEQYQFPDRIADIDKNSFIYLHGNSSDGLFYCRTWVPVTNYNP